MREGRQLDIKAKLLVFLVFLVLGVMISTQFKSTEHQKNIYTARVEDLSERLKVAEAEKKQLRAELESLRKEQGNMVAHNELKRLQLLSGAVPVQGKGIEIILDDSKLQKSGQDNPNLYLIHDEDLLQVLNELRAAGAEALAINEQRIVATSEIRCTGPTVSINNRQSSPPYVIKAIGNPKNLLSALKLRGGVLETFEFWGIQVQLKQLEKLELPAFEGRYGYDFAKPLGKEEA